MLFFQVFMTNLVLTKSSGPKSHAVAFTGPIFAGFSVCHTGLSGGGGGRKELAYTIDLSRPDMIPPTLLSVWQPSLTGVGSLTHKSCGRIRPHS
jgi:hypothetical protein